MVLNQQNLVCLPLQSRTPVEIKYISGNMPIVSPTFKTEVVFLKSLECESYYNERNDEIVHIQFTQRQ
jgi:hypothetical protein